MYSFDDRNGDNLSLRPEGTAGCVRAADQHGLLYNQQQRLWYQGPMFRHERPQKGRYRQFQQFGVEAFGMSGPDIDAELIQLSADLWRELDIAEALVLQINNIGASAERKAFGAALTAYLEGIANASMTTRAIGSTVIRCAFSTAKIPTCKRSWRKRRCSLTM